MILITGASGQLGRLVIDNLLNTTPANQIVAAVRNPETIADLRAFKSAKRITAILILLLRLCKAWKKYSWFLPAKWVNVLSNTAMLSMPPKKRGLL